MFWYILAGLPILLLLRRVLRKKALGSLANKPAQEPPIVTTKNGQVSGEWLRSSKGRPYASFKGIPYAKPPVGKLRFMRPEPVDNWTGVKKCTKSAEFCQINVFQSGNPRTGQEDALVLNVNSPNIQGKLPVMVFIHGGAFSSGSCSTKLYGAEYFMNKDVVLVAINYRLAVLGFLYLDGEKVCGNQGMRDQVLALRWVKDNIEKFGGDSNNITIFGESAGGMSVMNHIVSPMSAGLFNAAIVQSGSPKSPYCCLNKHPAYYAYKIAEHLGIDRNLPVEQIIEKLQKMDPFEIQEKVGVLEEFVRAPVYCKPILDGGLVEDPFMPEEPMELIKKGKFNKVPVIMGANENEGLLIKAFYEKDGVKFEEAWNNFETVGPLAFFATEKSEVQDEEVKLCMEYRNKHFGNTVFCTDKQSTDKFIEMYGDFLFVAPCYLAACEMSQHVPVFLYSYNYPGTLSLYPVVALTPAKLGLHFFLKFTFGLDLMTSSTGVCHGDELFVMFKPSIIPTQYIKSPEEQGVSEELVEMWSSFATHKHPTPSNKKWKEFNVEDSEYFEISAKSGMMRNESYISRMQEWKVMWDKIPTTFRRYSSPTWRQFPGVRYPIPEAETGIGHEDIKIDTTHEEEIIEDKKDSSSSSSSSSSSEDENEPEAVESVTVENIELTAAAEKDISDEAEDERVECYFEENLRESSEIGEMKIESSLTVESISVSSVTTESIMQSSITRQNLIESSVTRENLTESRIETAGTASSSSSSSGDNGSIEIVDREEVVQVIKNDIESDSEC